MAPCNHVRIVAPLTLETFSGIMGIAELLEFATTFYTLFPGDVLLTGTPEGVGPLAAGDCIGAVISDIGSMKVYVR